MSFKTFTTIVVVLFIFFLINIVFFTVGEKETVIITQFGKLVKTITEPGLNAKLPYPIQKIIRFDKRILTYDPPPSEYLTSDKKNIIIDSFMSWKIKDPEKFLVTVNNRQGAESRLSDIMFSEIGAALGNNPLTSFISTIPENLKIDSIMSEVTRMSNDRALKEYGIEIMDIQIKRLNFPEQNKESVFARMRAERKRIAKKYRSEGEEEAMKIRARADMEKRRIISEAIRDSQRIKGEGDAQAIKIYAGAFNKNPDFYNFIRTLQAYEKFMNQKTTVILPEDSELLKYLKKSGSKQK